ncbi:MAG: DUF1538 domain-containing protein [Coriobacteriales bacterium]|nr:DUF1538 domain-containing protein [Coriobacteriales bacterium]
MDRNSLRTKLIEALRAVIPIVCIVLAFCFTAAPVEADFMLTFLLGSVLLTLGLGLFTFGADASMTLIGTHIGSKLTASRKLGVILGISLLLGIIITVAEPDLQVLAQTVPHIDTLVLILIVAVGVGLFLMLAMFRILTGIKLKWLLLVSYTLVFVLAFFSDPAYLAIAFDSGGATTGPMTAPFIMSMGIGVAAIRSDSNAEADSFGLLALCSIGPILSVLILGFFYPGDIQQYVPAVFATYENTRDIAAAYLGGLVTYALEVALALAPIVIFFLIFQVFSLKMPRLPFVRILIGLVFTYLGLVLFLTGVNVGFSTLGTKLGTQLVSDTWMQLLAIAGAACMGWFVVAAEPAVHVLTKQVEEISAGTVSARVMQTSLSLAVAIAAGLSVWRIFAGVNILWILLPGYGIALALSFVVPQLFTAIAFDSGGVASGPMTATFMLPFAIGVCSAYGGNVITDAFGLVAMVAMTPLIVVQVVGLVARIRERAAIADLAETSDDYQVIELWEVE